VARYSDEQISKFLKEIKPLSKDWDSKIQFKEERSGKHCNFEVEGEYRNRFSVILRQNRFDNEHFSAILGIYPQSSNKIFRLRRYDGNSHAHTNSIEGETLYYEYHIHSATERYQDQGGYEDAFAVISDRYSNLDEAFSCLLHDCNFKMPSEQQLSAFGHLVGYLEENEL
jgi:hypothetical protein